MNEEEKENIENLKSFLYTDTITQYGKRKLIKIYEEVIEKQQKEIEELENFRFRALKRISELENDNACLLAKGDIDSYLDFKNNYISKSKIKKILADLKSEDIYVCLGGRTCGKTIMQGIKIGKIEMCEELLKEENKL